MRCTLCEGSSVGAILCYLCRKQLYPLVNIQKTMENHHLDPFGISKSTVNEPFSIEKTVSHYQRLASFWWSLSHGSQRPFWVGIIESLSAPSVLIPRCPRISRSNFLMSIKPPTIRMWMSPSWTSSGWWLGTFFYFPYIRNNHTNWLSYFSEGLKPPTSHQWLL